MQTPTVKVVSPVSEQNQHGYIVINESDLTDEHELFDKPEQKPLTIGQLREALTDAGVQFDEGLKKAELLELYEKL